MLLYAPFACVLVAYLVMPWRVGAAVMLNVRLAPLLVLFAFLPTRLPRKSRLASLAIGLGLVANIIGGVTAMIECRASQRELGDLDAVLDAMPAGSRVMTLSFDHRSRTTQVFPWAHVGAYHRVRGGGVAGFSFTELRHWPLRYVESERPPKKPATWDLDPCSFRNAVDGRYYDFVLVRGAVDPFAEEPPGPIFHRAVATGPMTLYRKEPGEWPGSTEPDRGPCRASSSE